MYTMKMTKIFGKSKKALILTISYMAHWTTKEDYNPVY